MKGYLQPASACHSESWWGKPQGVGSVAPPEARRSGTSRLGEPRGDQLRLAARGRPGLASLRGIGCAP